MRDDIPDYKVPVFAAFRGIGAYTLVAITVGGVCLLIDASRPLVDAVFIALGVGCLAVAAWATWQFYLEDTRAQRARATRAATTTTRPSATPGPTTTTPSASRVNTGALIVAIAINALGLIGLLVLIAGLIAHQLVLTITGAAPFALFLLLTAVVRPALAARHRAPKRPRAGV